MDFERRQRRAARAADGEVGAVAVCAEERALDSTALARRGARDDDGGGGIAKEAGRVAVEGVDVPASNLGR